MINWQEVRNKFPGTKEITYLNAAGAGLVAQETADAAKSLYDHMIKRGDQHVWEHFTKRIEEIRKQVADFINAEPEEIMFTLSTAHGINLITDILKQQPELNESEVLTMSDEFPSTSLPWIHKNYKVKFLEPENCTYTPERIQNALTETTKILITSHVQFGTGFRQDITELGKVAKANNLIYIVNATQSIGVFPIDVKKIQADFLVFTGLKWPATGYGIGVMYINKKWLDPKNFPTIGWRSGEDPFQFENQNLEIRKAASAMEVGCPHFAGIFALGAAIKIMNQVKPENSSQRLIELTDYLIEKLKSLNIEIISCTSQEHRSGIIVVKIDNPSETVKRLAEKNIIVAKRGDYLRISPHIYNNKSDIDTLIKELSALPTSPPI